MYIVNRLPTPKHRARTIAVSLLVVGVIAGSGAAAWQNLDSDTKISRTPAPVVSKVLGAKSKTRNFTAGPVSLDLPRDWEQFTPETAPAGSVSWRNTAGNKGVRIITLYIDAIPTEYPLNRVLAVEARDNRITLLGGVSDNCVNFSGQGRVVSGGNGKSPARWEGVQFTCDTANYVRNVVGISSAELPGAVNLNGTTGSHRLFAVYTDADASPNHSLFTTAIESLRVK